MSEPGQKSSQLISLEQVLEKLGDHAPESNSGEDSHQDYLTEVISAAKANRSLLTAEEIAHVLAAEFVMEALSREEIPEESPENINTVLYSAKLSKMNPKLAAALKVVEAVIKNSGSYEEALRAGVIALEGCIPYVGGIIAAITSVLWPQHKKSAWDQVKDQVDKVVQNAIFDNEFRIVSSKIIAIQKSLEQYVESPSNTEQGNILSASMVLMNSLYERVNQSKYRHMLIGLMAPIGALHLTILSERYNHYEALYGEADRSVPLKNLKSTYDQYQKFFEEAYAEWKKWRDDGLKVFNDAEQFLWNKWYNSGVKDELGIYNFGYSRSDRQRADDFKKWAMNRSIADVADAASGTASYAIFFKDIDYELKPILPELDTLELGPYMWTRFQGTGNMENRLVGNWSRDQPKEAVNEINVYAYNSVDGIQFNYPNRNGTKVTGGGGSSFHLNLKDKHCIGAKLGYSRGVLFRIQFFFADGSKSPVYGNRAGWEATASPDATVGGGYRLVSGNFVLGHGPSGTKGVNGVKLHFERV